MTLTSTTVRSTHTGDGTTVTFSYGFKIFSETEVAVYVAGVLKTITTHYTVSGVGSSTGGNITFETSAKPASSESIVFVRVPARTQTTDYTMTGTIDPQTVEDALDKTTMLIQDIGDSSDTAFGFANTVTDAGTTKISSNASDRGSKLLAFDSSGNLVADQEIGTFKGNWAASTAYVVSDIIKDTNNNNIYICNTSHTSSGAVPISTNTDVAKWDLLVDAASASTSATAAASSASASATSATAAATSATSSASSATSSASSATSSASSATSSANSATSSASSATASAASASEASTHASNAAANSGPYYSATTGTDTYVATPNPALATYEEGVDIILKFGTSNTGATTLNVSGLGAKDLTKADGSAFSSGELTSGQIQHFVYNGTEFRLMGTVAATEELIKINTLDIFQNTINDMADHSDNLLETVDGFTDNFQDGSTQNNTAFDLINSSGVTHDNSNKVWGNTDGATGANDDKPYTTESNYVQQEWDETIVGANAVFTNGSATVTTSGTFPTNCANGRISQDGTNWYDIDSRDSATQLTLTSNFAQSTVTGTFTIRMTKFDSGVVKLNSGASNGIDSNAKLVLHFDGSNGGTTFTDSSSTGHSVTANGNANTTTAQKKFGTTSVLFDGTGDYLSVPNHNDWDIMSSASSEFTIDCWVRLVVNSGMHAICAIGSTSSYHWSLAINRSSNTIEFARYDAATSPTSSSIVFSSSGITADTWFHVALIKGWGGSAGSIACCVDGTQIGSVTTGDTWYQPTSMSGDLTVGRHAYNYTAWDFWGYMDELRISNTARWTSNFTPPTTAYLGADNVASEYVSVADSYAQSTDVSAWTDVNSSAITETLSSQNVYYWVIFSAASAYGANTEVSIFNQTGSVWRTIAKNSAGTWQYNNNASHDATQTLVNSTVNDMLHAVSQAISTQAANRMTGTEAAAISDAEWEATNGFATSDTLLTRGLTLYSASSSQNPEVSLFRVNYDSDNADGTFLTRAFGGTNMPPAPSSNINTMVALIIDKRTTGTPTYEASSNGGTTWTEFSTWVHEDLMSNGYTKRMAEIDVSAHTGARTSPLIRIKNGSLGEDYDLKAIGIKYK